MTGVKYQWNCCSRDAIKYYSLFFFAFRPEDLLEALPFELQPYDEASNRFRKRFFFKRLVCMSMGGGERMVKKHFFSIFAKTMQDQKKIALKNFSILVLNILKEKIVTIFYFCRLYAQKFTPPPPPSTRLFILSILGDNSNRPNFLI